MFQIVFLVWVSLNEQKWVTFAERRRSVAYNAIFATVPDAHYPKLPKSGQAPAQYGAVAPAILALRIARYCTLGPSGTVP